jgi:hypothetical protein
MIIAGHQHIEVDESLDVVFHGCDGSRNVGEIIAFAAERLGLQPGDAAAVVIAGLLVLGERELVTISHR